MANFELKAVLQLEDKLSQPMKIASRSVDDFSARISGAIRQIERFNAAQRALTGGGSAFSKSSKDMADASGRMNAGLKSLKSNIQGAGAEVVRASRTVSDYTKTVATAAAEEEKRKTITVKNAAEMAKAETIYTGKYLVETEKRLKSEASRDKTAIAGQNALALNAQKTANDIALANVRKDSMIEVSGVKTYNAERVLLARKAVESAKTNGKIELENVKHRNKLEQTSARSEAKLTYESVRESNIRIRQGEREASALISAANRAAASRRRAIGNGVVSGAGNILSGAGNAAKLYGGVAAGVAGYAVYNQASQGIQQAATFEQAMQDIKVLLDPKEKTDANMEQLKKSIMDMSENSLYSNADIATAANVLQKAGSSIDQITKGGQLKSALNFAQAVGWDTTNSAETMAVMQTTFKKDHMSSDQVANLLTGVANASVTSGSEIALGMRQAGNVANTVGLSAKDTASWIGLMSFDGMTSGSDAGTSIKTLLGQFVNRSKPATETMKDIGLIDKNGQNTLFDKNGTMKDLKTISEIVYNSTKNLNSQKRLEAFNQIGGDDAVRSLTGLFNIGQDIKKNGDKGQYGTFMKQVNEADAAKIATERSQTALGDYTKLRNAIKNVWTMVFEPMFKPIGEMMGGFKGYLEKRKPDIIKFGQSLADGVSAWFKGLTSSSQWAAAGNSVFGKLGAIVSYSFDQFTGWLGTPNGEKFKAETMDSIVGVTKFLIKGIWTAIEQLFSTIIGDLGEKIKNGDWGSAAIEGLIGGLILNKLTGGLVGKIVKTIGVEIIAGTLGAVGLGTLAGKIRGGGGSTGGGGGGSTPVGKVGNSGSGTGGMKTTIPSPGEYRPGSQPGGFNKVVSDYWGTSAPTSNAVTNISTAASKLDVVATKIAPTANFLGNALLLLQAYDLSKGHGLLTTETQTYTNEHPWNPTWDMDPSKLSKKKAEQELQKLVDVYNGADYNYASGDIMTAVTKKMVGNYRPSYSSEDLRTDLNNPVAIADYQAYVSKLEEISGKQLSEYSKSFADQLEKTPPQQTVFGSSMAAAVSQRDYRITQDAINQAGSYIRMAPNSANTSFSMFNPFLLPPAGTPSSNAGGVHRVGSDGVHYLHKDEAVLSRGDAARYRNGGGGNLNIGSLIGSATIREEADIDKLAKSLAREIYTAKELMGNV